MPATSPGSCCRSIGPVDASLFDQVLDAFEAMVADVDGLRHARTHGRGIKVWYDESTREHYEAQLLRVDGEPALEIGFHAEHPKADTNEAALAPFRESEASWRAELGDEPVIGPFLGADRWRRISELWPPPDGEQPDVDEVIEIAARLAEYVLVLEPIRRGTGNRVSRQG